MAFSFIILVIVYSRLKKHFIAILKYIAIHLNGRVLKILNLLNFGNYFK